MPLCLRAPINICLVSLCPTPNRIFTPEDREGGRERERGRGRLPLHRSPLISWVGGNWHGGRARAAGAGMIRSVALAVASERAIDRSKERRQIDRWNDRRDRGNRRGGAAWKTMKIKSLHQQPPPLSPALSPGRSAAAMILMR